MIEHSNDDGSGDDSEVIDDINDDDDDDVTGNDNYHAPKRYIASTCTLCTSGQRLCCHQLCILV